MTSFDNIARVYDKVNERQGHLRIDVGDVDADGEFWPQQTYRFMNHDDGKILFGAHGGPSGMLDADALRRIAEYCSNRADVIEGVDHSARARVDELAVEVSVIRDPDNGTEVRAFVDGAEPSKYPVFELDAGKGWHDADWREHVKWIRETASPAVLDHLADYLDAPPGAEFIEGGQ